MFDLFYKMKDICSEDSFFWFFALLGFGFFILQFALGALGGEGHQDSDGWEIDSGKFIWLSKQGIIGFVMMFGWIGLTCRKQFGMSDFLSTTIALAGGVVTVLLTALFFKGVKMLRSGGTVFRIEDAVGKKATVYQQIPKNGVGKVSVFLDQFTHEIDAISEESEDLPSFSLVQIVKTADEKTVLVVPIK